MAPDSPNNLHFQNLLVGNPVTLWHQVLQQQSKQSQSRATPVFLMAPDFRNNLHFQNLLVGPF